MSTLGPSNRNYWLSKIEYATVKFYHLAYQIMFSILKRKAPKKIFTEEEKQAEIECGKAEFREVRKKQAV